MYADTLLIQHRAHIVAGRFTEAETIMRELEASIPASEMAWQSLYEFFTKLQKVVWAYIMTKRFLEIEPNNVSARIAMARYFSNIPSKKDEAIIQLGLVSVESITSSSLLLEMAGIFFKCGLPDCALGSMKAASHLDPNDMGVRVKIAAHFIKIGAKRQAKREILAIRDRARLDVHILCTAMELALRLENRALVRVLFRQALQMLIPGDQRHTPRLILIAAKSEQLGKLTDLMASVNFTKVGTAAELAAIHTAIEGLGFFEQERSLVSHGLTLEPDNAVLTAAANRQNLPISKALQSVRKLTTPQRLGLSSAALSYFRTLAFWR
jgi:hypothetical protein